MRILTLEEAKDKREKLYNNLVRLENEKEMAFERTQPGSKPFDIEPVSGSHKAIDKNLEYVSKVIEIEPDIESLKKEIDILDRFIIAEESRINKSPSKKQKVIKLRNEGKTWNYISAMLGVSDRTCRFWYKKYKDGE